MTNSIIFRFSRIGVSLVAAVAAVQSFAHSGSDNRAGRDADPTHIVEVKASTRAERTAITEMGFSLEEFRSDKVYIYGKEQDAARLNAAGFEAKAVLIKPEWR